MLILTFVAFAAFACCVLAQFYFIRQVRRILANNHPDVWRDLSNRAFFVDNAIQGFVWRKRYKTLGDPELERAVRRMRMLQIVAFAVWLFYAATIFTRVGAPTSGIL